MSASVQTLLPASDPAGLLTPLQFLGVLRHRAWLILLCAMAGGGGLYATAVARPKVYTASTLISVDSARFLIPELQGAVSTSNSSDSLALVHTEAQALSSPQMLQQVVETLGLARDPEFNPLLRPPTPVARLINALRALLPQPGDAGPPGPEAWAAQQRSAILGEITQALTVFQDNRSLVISVSFTSQHPPLAAAFLNTLIAKYVGFLEDRRGASDRAANATLQQQLRLVSDEIERLQQRIGALRRATELVGLRAGSVGQQQLEDLAAAVTQASVQRGQSEATWQRAEALARQGHPEALSNVLDSPTISRLRDQEAAALTRLADLSLRYGAEHPSLQSARSDVAVARQQLAQEAQRIVAALATQLAVARAHEADTRQQLAVARAAGVQTAGTQAELDQLEQEIEARRKLYQSLLQGLQQSGNRSPGQSAIPDIRVLSVAAVPGYPSGPNTRLAGILGLLGGTIGGMGMCLVGRRERPMSSAVEVTRATGLTVLGVLRGAAPGRAGGAPLAARVAQSPAGPEAEELRLLRARLRTGVNGRAPRSVAFTAAGRREDAAGVAAGLARVAAMDGERVLLIEGDLAQPTMAGLLGAPGFGEPGFGEPGSQWRTRLRRDAHTPLDLLLAGPAAAAHPVPYGHLLQNLLIEAAEDYTLVVVGAPPLRNGSGALTFAQCVDAAVVVIDAGLSNRAQTCEATARMAGAAPALAAVLVGAA